uniref:C-type lectin domain-containing protein n=1 Tax=Myripristis murdjan TaxID=586833 RepID=A0A668A4K5_9TELE
MQGGTVVQWLALSPHSEKVLGSIPTQGPFCVEFACSPRVCVSFLQALRFPPLVACCLGILCVILVATIVTLCFYRKNTHTIKETKSFSYLDFQDVQVNNKRRRNPCQEGWLLSPSKSSCYLVITTNNFNEWKTWEEAAEDCRQRNAVLVVIENQQEQVKGTRQEQRGVSIYWIGLRRTSGVWKWLDGSDLTENYWIYQPLDNTDCAVSVQWSSPKGWIDEKCADKNQWICEMKALSV